MDNASFEAWPQKTANITRSCARHVNDRLGKATALLIDRYSLCAPHGCESLCLTYSVEVLKSMECLPILR